MLSPRISVIMAVYNSESYVDQAIESILNQTFTDFEFIIVEDGSTDNSLQIVRKYAQADARLRIIENERNIGLSASLNKGLCAARGEYVARMDADDISLPHRLEEQIRFMDEHSEVGVLGTAFTLMDEYGNYVQNTVFSSNPDILKWDLLFFNPIAHPSALMRSSTIRKVGGYNTKLTSAQDYELWTRVILTGRLANLKEIHMLLRLHKERVTHKHRDRQIAVTSEAKQKYLQVILHRGILSETASDLRQKPITAQRAARAASLILDYCDYCSKDASSLVVVRIRGQALEKATRKVGRFIVYPATWGIVIRLCLLLLRLVATWLRVAGDRLIGMLSRFLSITSPDQKGPST